MPLLAGKVLEPAATVQLSIVVHSGQALPACMSRGMSCAARAIYLQAKGLANVHWTACLHCHNSNVC